MSLRVWFYAALRNCPVIPRQGVMTHEGMSRATEGVIFSVRYYGHMGL